MKNNTMQKNIPDGWHEVKFGSCLDKNPEYGINAASTKYSRDLPTYIRITDISDDGNLIQENLTSVSHVNSDNYYLNEGDLVFTRTGASVGKTYLYKKSDGRLVFAGFLIRVKTNKTKVIPEYLHFFTKTHEYWKWILITSSRSGQPGINSQELKSLKLSLPPIPEQRRIVGVLEVWDWAIEKLARKIGVKKNIKKGLMQQLLTGKKRLPGFTEEWQATTMGEIGEIITGSTPPMQDAENYNGIFCWATAEDFISKYIINTRIKLSEIGRTKSRVLPAGSILVTCIASIGKNAIAGTTLATNQQINAIVVYEKNDNEFIYYLIESSVNLLKRTAGAGAMAILNKSEFSKIKIRMPKSKEEQNIIANILATADDEITQLEKKLSLFKQQKKFLLNKLVSGEIRVSETICIDPRVKPEDDKKGIEMAGKASLC